MNTDIGANITTTKQHFALVGLSILIAIAALGTPLLIMVLIDFSSAADVQQSILALIIGLIIFSSSEHLLRRVRNHYSCAILRRINHICARQLFAKSHLKQAYDNSYQATISEHLELSSPQRSKLLEARYDLVSSIAFISLLGWFDLRLCIVPLVGITTLALLQRWNNRAQSDNSQDYKATPQASPTQLNPLAANQSALTRLIGHLEQQSRDTNHQFIAQMSYVLTLASAAVMIINGSLHLVTLLPIILVSGRIAPPVISYLKTGDSRQQLCEFIAKAKVIAAAPEQALKITQAPHTVTLNRVNYQSAQQLTLRDINLSLERGFHTALYGKANAGLEKLLRITAGLEAPTNGNVLIGDQNMLEFDHLDIAQHLHFYRCADFRQRVNIEALINAGQRDQTEWAREQLRQHFAISNTTTKALSPQESQLLAICLAFTHQPTFLLLHMPFRALSPKNRMLLGNFLRSQSSSTTLIYTADKQADAWLGERQIEVNLGAIRNIVGVNALDG